jgi:hypothetical protein
MADPAFVEFEHGWVFPQTLGGMPYESCEIYANTDLGYSIFYRDGDAFNAELSICTLGQTSIPDGCGHSGINLVLESVESALELQLRQQQILRFKKRGTTVVPKQGDIQFKSGVFQFIGAETTAAQKIRAVYATGQGGRFVKLQFTFNLLKNKEARSRADQMIAQLIDAVQTRDDEQELLLASCSAFLHDPGGYGGRIAAQHFMAKVQDMGNLNVLTELFVWPDGYRKPKNADLLIAAYFAGMLQVVVPQQLDEGGEYEAFIAMLEAYRIMRSKEQLPALPEFDEWLVTPDKKALLQKLLED